MAQDPKNYRDPKVTTGSRSGGDAMRWVWIAAAVIVVLLLLAWIFGWFGRDAAVTTPVATPTEEPVAPPATEPLDTAPAAPEPEVTPLPPQEEEVTPLPAPAD